MKWWMKLLFFFRIRRYKEFFSKNVHYAPVEFDDNAYIHDKYFRTTMYRCEKTDSVVIREREIFVEDCFPVLKDAKRNIRRIGLAPDQIKKREREREEQQKRDREELERYLNKVRVKHKDIWEDGIVEADKDDVE